MQLSANGSHHALQEERIASGFAARKRTTCCFSNGNRSAVRCHPLGAGGTPGHETAEPHQPNFRDVRLYSEAVSYLPSSPIRATNGTDLSKRKTEFLSMGGSQEWFPARRPSVEAWPDRWGSGLAATPQGISGPANFFL